MKRLLINLGSSALIAAILVTPFIVLELVNRRMFNEDFPFGLFVILWLLPVAFLLILIPMVQNIRAGNNVLVSPLGILIGVVC